MVGLGSSKIVIEATFLHDEENTLEEKLSTHAAFYLPLIPLIHLSPKAMSIS
jgi:hypothetical protein